MNEAEMPAAPSAHPWFAVQIKPNSEAIAKRNLLRQDLEIFAPFEMVTKRRASKLVQASRPLFPGYFFVNFDPDVVRWRAINSTYGVSRLISFADNRPAEVAPELIEGLMRRCDASGKLLPPDSLNSGDLVRVADGPFADFVGTVEQIAPDRRVWVLLDILGKGTRVAIRPSDLRLAG